MTQTKLDAIIEARVRQKQEQQSYHKRSALLAVRSSLEKMMIGNLSIKEQTEILAEAGTTVSDRSLREFLAREFGDVYTDFLKRNGWVRKKRQKEDNG